MFLTKFPEKECFPSQTEKKSSIIEFLYIQSKFGAKP